MIISSGEFRGFKLKTPKGLSTRPTSAKIRQAFFNIYRSELNGCFFLDIFAGSGAMGLEALSEGASFALFIENNFQAIKCIKENISSLKLESKTKIIKDVSLLKKTSFKFGFVYIDPPYKFYLEKDFFLNILRSISQNLLSGAVIVFEAPFIKNREIEAPEGFKIETIRKYSDSCLIIFNYC